MAYYLERKYQVKSINIKNSVYNIGNYAHEYLVNTQFLKVTFINTTMNRIDNSKLYPYAFKSLIYKKVNEATHFHILYTKLPEFKAFDSILYLSQVRDLQKREAL